MQMLYCLQSILTAVDHDSVAVLKAQLRSDILDLQHHISQDVRVLIGDIIDGCDVLLRDEQAVYRRLRIHIVEAENLIIFVNFVRWDLTISDHTE